MGFLGTAAAWRKVAKAILVYMRGRTRMLFDRKSRASYQFQFDAELVFNLLNASAARVVYLRISADKYFLHLSLAVHATTNSIP